MSSAQRSNEQQPPQSRRSSFDSPGFDLAAVAIACCLTGLIPREVLSQSNEWLRDDDAAIQGVLVGLHGSLLGFILAALAIVIGFSNAPQLKVLKVAGKLGSLFAAYMAAIRTHALGLTVSLIGLVVTPPTFWNSLVIWSAACVTALSLARLGRVLSITSWIVNRLSTDLSRKPDQASPPPSQALSDQGSEVGPTQAHSQQ